MKSLQSDNGTNFVGAERELKESIEDWNQLHIQTFLLQRGIQWTFSVPLGSHQNGIWEREIRTIRNVLSALVNDQPINLHEEEFRTLMCEVESILNGRPLTPTV